MKVYLDNAATTKPLATVISIVNELMIDDYGNPSSMHAMGLNAEKIVKKSREYVADALDVEEKEVYFTSGATESNNTAIFGAVNLNKKRGNHIITSKIEHPSVLACFEKLEKDGFEVTYLDVNKDGIIDIEQLKCSIKDTTIFVSIMTVNNEIGSVQPISEIAKLKNKYNFIFHTDAVQAFKKLPSEMFNMADLITISGHKVHGLKGIGALIVKNNIKIKPLILGGGQERDFRSGTENVTGIASLGAAANYNFNPEKISNLKNMLLDGMRNIPGIIINSENSKAPHIINATFVGKRGEVVLHELENRGIYVSAGSACHSNKFGESHVLKAIGLGKEMIGATLRFSLGEFNTESEIKYVIENLKEVVNL